MPIAIISALALVLGLLVAPRVAPPATVPTDDPRPVTVFALTDAAGERTEVAVAGLADLPLVATAPALQAGAVVGGFRSAGRPTLEASAGDAADLAVLTPPMATPEFMVAALTWACDDDLPDGARVFLRVYEHGEWSDWLETADDEAAPDGARGPRGTEPFVTGGAEAVQVQVTGDGADLPADLQLSLIPGDPLPAVAELDEPTEAPEELPADDPVAGVGAAPTSIGSSAAVSLAAYVTTTAPAVRVSAAVPSAVAPAALSRPAIVSRAGWGADESLMTWSPTYATLKAAVVHHTAGTNTYTAAQSASVVRSIYSYHAVTRDWGDIGYNFLVDKYGTVFEGRSGSLGAAATVMPIGAHALNFNTGSMGLSAMGDYTLVDAPQVILDRMAGVIAWKFDAAGIDPGTASGFVSPGTTYRPAGQALPRIFAHRDVGATVCPGDDIYGRLASLRTAVDDLLAPPAPEPFFDDVPVGAAFFDDIQWLAAEGITTGWEQGDGSIFFSPSDPITREAMAAFVYRFAGKPPFSPPAASPFADLTPGAAFYQEITWLEAEDIAPGAGDPGGEAAFRPSDLVTREVMALWLFRALADPSYSPPTASPFSDVARAHPSYREIAWLHASGISSGVPNGDGTFAFVPEDPISREAMAAFFHRADPLR